MRKILSLLMVTALILALATIAYASDYEGLADDLAAIGMFTGTDEGYDLDREPTRAEVAVMLVRMLGAATQAKDGYANGSLTHPFSDVPQWAAPDIAYLYTKGLTSGVTDSEFGSGQLCSGQMYCTFMLRALGYSDAEGGDFSYAGALDFAEEKSLVISGFVSDSFTRDELVAVSHQTLRTPVKGGEQTLLEKLTAAGTVNKASAATLTKSDDIIRECSGIFAHNISDYSALDCSMKFDLTASIRQKALANIFMYKFLADLKFIYADTASKADFAFTMVDPISNEQLDMHVWIKDGWFYLQDGEERTKVQIDYEEIRETYENMKQQMDTGIADVENTAIPSYVLSKAVKTETDEGTLYEFAISPKYIRALIRQATGDTPQGSVADSVVIHSASITETILVKGTTVKKSSLIMDIDLESSQFGRVAGKLDFDVTINAAGDNVSINYPDFSGFVEEKTDSTKENIAEAVGE
jgi:hypothetical protein